MAVASLLADLEVETMKYTDFRYGEEAVRKTILTVWKAKRSRTRTEGFETLREAVTLWF